MKTTLGRLVPGIALIGLASGICGCEVNSFIDPKEPHIRDKDSQPLIVPIVDTLDRSVEEKDSAFSAAADPRPEDLVPDVADYRIGKNDLVSISIFDLLGEGTGETVKTARVSETGTISLPFISPVKAEGLTEQDLEQAIIKAYQDAKLIRQARVSVTVAEARGRTFSVQGNVAAGGEYQITKPDFRMLDALVVAHGPAQSQGVPYAYVIRRKSSDRTVPATPAGGAPATQPSSQPVDLLEPHSQADPGAANRVLLLAAGSTTSPTTAPSSDLLAPGADLPPSGVIDNRAAPMAGGDTTMMPATAQPGASFAFNDLQAPTDIRVIRVPIDKLRQGGELQYNIVIRAGDMIIVPDPVVGEYYMGGHVVRVGVYSLAARNLTLKDAWISAGGGDEMAIPGRTEIIRRIGGNREVFVRVDLDKIWSGLQPDIFLKPYDIVQVGTNLGAPFLSAVRNSFRITYGFGFLYDRNFGPAQNNGF